MKEGYIPRIRSTWFGRGAFHHSTGLSRHLESQRRKLHCQQWILDYRRVTPRVMESRDGDRFALSLKGWLGEGESGRSTRDVVARSQLVLRQLLILLT